jgi:uncharacterized SAM-binding protein YcdF (DUF218 family)
MWDLLFYPGKIASYLLLPPTGFVLFALLALFFINRWPRTARLALWLSIGSLLVLSLPSVSKGLIALLDAPPLDSQRAKSAQAVMILGGGLIHATPEYGDTLSSYTLARTRYGARLAKQFRIPILVTGGRVYGEGAAEADVMAAALANEFDIPARWIENKSRHTGENAQFSAAILKRDKINRVILVTDDFHMRRALAHCEAAGLICFPAPVSTINHESESWIEQLPNAGSLQTSSIAVRDLIGNIVLRWR